MPNTDHSTPLLPEATAKLLSERAPAPEKSNAQSKDANSFDPGPPCCRHGYHPPQPR